MHMNRDWNAAYLRQYAGDEGGDQGEGGGVSADAIAAAVGGIATGAGGIASAFFNYKSAREQAAVQDKANRLAYKQSRESNIATQNMMTINLLQQQEALKSRSSVVKTVVIGLGALAVIGGVVVVAVQALKSSS